ncbi:hypothetical protein A2U01_0000263 [Trifolium medium]|uniref:Uncharacterized protein n=1 Tax=Trifolium medium TaxID=97028 RepID=A0A392LX29_9FABA|nr:hypothetical protein [Trifolium medium]
MVILRELHDDPGRLLTPLSLNSDLMRQIRSHYTRAGGSLNKRGFYTELFGTPVSSSGSESSEESDSDSSGDNDCYIIPRSSFTGKNLVPFNPVVFEDLTSKMETSSKFTSADSVRCFREVNKLYSDDDENQVIVDPVREGELITTVNGEAPHYFYMYGDIIRSFNMWFPFTSFEDTILRILNIAPSQLHPNSWAFVKAFEIVCMGLEIEPWLVHDAHLTPFEKRTVAFLDNFCHLDTKDLLQRETDVDSIVVYLKRMRTVSEEDWLSYLAISSQKKLEPYALVSPEVQLVVGETDAARGAKRKRRGETVRSSKASNKNDGSSSQVVDLEASGSQPSSPQAKGVRSLRSRTTIPVKPAGEDTSTQEGVSGAPKDATVKDVTGDSSRFDSIATSELRKLVLSHEVKGLVLNHLLSARHEKEVVNANSKVESMEKAALEIEVSYAAEKGKLSDEISRLKKAREDDVVAAKKEYYDVVGEMDGLKKHHADEKALLEKKIRQLTLMRNAFMVSCFQTGRDMWDLQGEVEDLEETNDGLKRSMADIYVEGFRSSIEKVKALFPNIDQEVLGQAYALKKVEGGNLVSRIPGAT